MPIWLEVWKACTEGQRLSGQRRRWDAWSTKKHHLSEVAEQIVKHWQKKRHAHTYYFKQRVWCKEPKQQASEVTGGEKVEYLTAILFSLTETDGEMRALHGECHCAQRAASQVSSCPYCKGRSVTVWTWSLKDTGPAMKSASYKILYFGISVFRLWFKPLKQLALGVWKALVALDRYGDYLKLVYTHVTFRSTAPKQEIYILVHVLRSKEYLVGSWAALLSSLGDLPPTRAMLGRRKCKLQPGLHCQGSIDHLLHKPHWQHC